MLAERVAVLETSPEPLSGSREAEADPTPAAARLRVNEAKLLRDTQYRERWLLWMTLHLRRTYADLQRLLGLPDAEYANFLATMAQLELEQALRSWTVTDNEVSWLPTSSPAQNKSETVPTGQLGDHRRRLSSRQWRLLPNFSATSAPQ